LHLLGFSLQTPVPTINQAVTNTEIFVDSSVPSSDPIRPFLLS
jgi:hypothetical protein